VKPTVEQLIAEVRALRDEVVRALGAAPVLVYTKVEAAKALRISVAQLYRLIAAGRLAAIPEGIAREELERYVRTPKPRMSAATRGRTTRPASVEAQRLEQMLRAEHKRRRRAT
jgi:hypothetical protein